VKPARLGTGDLDVPIVFALPRAAAQKLAELDAEGLSLTMQKVFEDPDAIVEDELDGGYIVDRVLSPLRALAIEAEKRGGVVCHFVRHF